MNVCWLVICDLIPGQLNSKYLGLQFILLSQVLLLCLIHTHLHKSVFLLDGGQRIQNIQPFTKRDLEIRSLGDRIRDINEITYLYPNLHKQEVFKKYYSGKAAHNSLNA